MYSSVHLQQLGVAKLDCYDWLNPVLLALSSLVVYIFHQCIYNFFAIFEFYILFIFQFEYILLSSFRSYKDSKLAMQVYYWSTV